MAEKTIIANYGYPNLGKTGSVKRVYENLAGIIKPADINIRHAPKSPEGDICAILTINKNLVGISSLGDYCPEHAQWLDELVKAECTIILAACQNGGKTMKKIESLNPPYRIYWSCNAHLYEAGTFPRVAPKGILDRFNENWAEEIANLIENWCYAYERILTKSKIL